MQVKDLRKDSFARQRDSPAVLIVIRKEIPEYLPFPVLLEIHRFQMNGLGLSRINSVWRGKLLLLFSGYEHGDFSIFVL